MWGRGTSRHRWRSPRGTRGLLDGRRHVVVLRVERPMGQERRSGRRPHDILELALQLPVLGLELDDLHVDPLGEALRVQAPLCEIVDGVLVRLGEVALHHLQARRDLLGEDVELVPQDLVARPRHRRRMVDHCLEAIGILEVSALHVLDALRVYVHHVDGLA